MSRRARTRAHALGIALGRVIAEQRRLEDRAARVEQQHRVRKALQRRRPSR